eukprot:1488871-Amphidinium_carterae.1
MHQQQGADGNASQPSCKVSLFREHGDVQVEQLRYRSSSAMYRTAVSCFKIPGLRHNHVPSDGESQLCCGGVLRMLFWHNPCFSLAVHCNLVLAPDI